MISKNILAFVPLTLAISIVESLFARPVFFAFVCLNKIIAPPTYFPLQRPRPPGPGGANKPPTKLDISSKKNTWLNTIHMRAVSFRQDGLNTKLRVTAPIR